jgi:hypothetical protein
MFFVQHSIGIFVLKKERFESHFDQLCCALQNGEFHLEQIDRQDILNGVLNRLTSVIFPGASIFEQIESLGEQAHKKLRKFVKSGRGYIGLCSGGFLAASSGFNGCNEENRIINVRVNWTRGVGYANLKLVSNFQRFIGVFSAAPSKIFFANGPRFGIPASMKPSKLFGNPVPIAVYERVEVTQHSQRADEKHVQTDFDDCEVAIAASSYGDGKMILFGPHPEASGLDWQAALVHALVWVSSH